MRKRNIHIQFWLDKKEAEAFQKKVKKSGLSREVYLRHLVNGLEPQDAPPPDYYAMMRQQPQSIRRKSPYPERTGCAAIRRKLPQAGRGYQNDHRRSHPAPPDEVMLLWRRHQSGV